MNAQVARRRLEAEWEQLLEAREAIAIEALSSQSEDESIGELSAVDQHQADVGSETFEREKDFSIRDQIERDLQAVRDAFTRVDSGRYGRCETCGATIPDERLAAVPSTRFCFDHERLWELRTLSVPVPPGNELTDGSVSAERAAAYEAGRHLELLPTDDEEPTLVLSAEELALRREATDTDPSDAIDLNELEIAESVETDS